MIAVLRTELIAKVARLKNFDDLFENKQPWEKHRRIGAYLGCHQRADRSFFIRGKQFPVCARCTGVLIGQSFAIILCVVGLRIPIYISVLFLLIMFTDWLIQKLNIKESTNIRRLVTGLLGGYGYVVLLAKLCSKIYSFI